MGRKKILERRLARLQAKKTKLTFGMKRYFDEEKNEWVNKGLTIVDGKILDPSGCYIIKKKATE